jgi:hypothetical protein
MEKNTLVDFRTAVREMRLWQKTYFKTRHPEALKESKAWEKEVDRQLDEDEQLKLDE